MFCRQNRKPHPDFGLPEGVRLGIFAALLPTGEIHRPRP